MVVIFAYLQLKKQRLLFESCAAILSTSTLQTSTTSSPDSQTSSQSQTLYDWLYRIAGKFGGLVVYITAAKLKSAKIPACI